MITLHDITQRFGARDVLSGIELTIGAGEIMGLIGPNGAGKTTTLKIVSTLLRPTRGTVTLRGQDAFADVRWSRQTVSYMPETLGMYDDMRVSEYLEFFCKAHRMSRAQAQTRVALVLTDVALRGLSGATLGTLSKGTRQRVSFARTFLHDPAVVLLDEPFSSLDPIGCRLIREVIRREADRGRAFLVSSHDMTELESLATRVVAIRDGQLLDRPRFSARVWEVRLDEPVERALALLSAPGLALELTRRDARTFLIEAPSETPPSSLLRPLVEAGVTIVAFVRRDQSLEEYFLEEFGEDADLG